MSNEPTAGELSRALADARLDFRERCAALGQRVDGMVPLALFNAHTETARREHDELAADIAALHARLDAEREQREAAERAERERREAAERQRASDRRVALTAVFTAVIAPLALMLVQFYMLRGRP